MRFDELIIYTDIDGTYLKSWDHNPYPGTNPNNIEQINRFIANGGLFSCASGREYNSALRCFEDVNLNMPIVQTNGAAIYDLDTNSFIFKSIIDLEIKKEFYDYALNNSNTYLCASDLTNIYDVKMNDFRDNGCFDLKRPLLNKEDFFNNDISKLCFVTRKENMDKVRKDVSRFKCYDLINCFNSSDIYFEVTNKSIDKGRSILKAIELKNICNRKLVCIGDQENDISMVEVADIKVCPKNSVKHILDIADIITCSNDDGALADLIFKLEKM